MAFNHQQQSYQHFYPQPHRPTVPDHQQQRQQQQQRLPQPQPYQHNLQISSHQAHPAFENPQHMYTQNYSSYPPRPATQYFTPQQANVNFISPQGQNYPNHYHQQAHQPPSSHIQSQQNPRPYHQTSHIPTNQYLPHVEHPSHINSNLSPGFAPQFQPHAPQRLQNIPAAVQPPPQQPQIPSKHPPQQPPPEFSNQRITIDLRDLSTTEMTPRSNPSPKTQRTRVLQNTQGNVPRPQKESHPTKTQLDGQAIEPEPPDYPTFLLGLADEYLDAAQKQPKHSQTAHKMIATALGCIETVLANFSLQPLKEAQLTLKHAQLLYDLTTNVDDAERMLTKAIELCERHRYIDLKYSLQILLSRVLYVSKPKAAKKDVQNMIEEAEIYHHHAWEYALRFHLAFMTASTGLPQDIRMAIAQLEKLANVARTNADHAVLVAAATLEALLHLQTNHPHADEACQQALGRARELQITDDETQNPQLMCLGEFVDLLSTLAANDAIDYDTKRPVMQDVLYKALEHPGWHKDGTSLLLLNKRSVGGVQLQDGGLVLEKGGSFYLTLRWLKRSEAEALGFLLSGVTCSRKLGGDNGKADQFLKLGLAVVRETIRETGEDGLGNDLAMLKHLELYYLLEMAFLQCSYGRWSAAVTILDELAEIQRSDGRCEDDKDIKITVAYLRGVLQQATGDLEAALSTFRSTTFSMDKLQQLDGSSEKTTPSVHSSRTHVQDRESITQQNFTILAKMNIVMILSQSPSPADQQEISSLLTWLRIIVEKNGSKTLRASYYLLITVQKDNSILREKSYLSHALKWGRGVGSAQIISLVLIMMQEKFFRGVVGEQAMKCAQAASHQAARWKDSLWCAVATGMEADCLDVQGLGGQAQAKKTEAEQFAAKVPEKIRHRIPPGLGSGGFKRGD